MDCVHIVPPLFKWHGPDNIGYVFLLLSNRSQVFYYSAGMSTGMIASLIILIFIMARFLPKVRSQVFYIKASPTTNTFWFEQSKKSGCTLIVHIWETFLICIMYESHKNICLDFIPHIFIFFSQKSPFYMVIVGGWSFSVYIIQLVFRNLQMILREHWHMAFGKYRL